MAPVRAVYEVVKRTGAHGLLLRAFIKTSRARPLVPIPAFELPSLLAEPVRERCLADSRAIVAEGHRVFGDRIEVSTTQGWSAIPGTSYHWPETDFWWDIDIRTEERLGDVKWTWELGRHRDLVVLARAAAIDPDGQWLNELEVRLRSFLTAFPPEVGIHWYSNLEIALRMIAWAQIFSLTHEKLDPEIIKRMTVHVAKAERHLVFDFPYTFSSMRNNHLLGDALGLLLIDRFRGGGGRTLTARIAERCFRQQLSRHMNPDGSMIEDSLSYHRFVMEMLLVKFSLGDHSEGTVDALRGSARHLVVLGVFNGDLPQWGDWDEGRVLASSNDPLDVAGSTAAVLTVARAAFDESWASDFDEVAWYSSQAWGSSQQFESLRPFLAEPSGSGTILHVSRGPWSAWLKIGLGSSHQHSDLGHLSLRHDESWITVDPGTGTYNGRLDIRNAFRSSAAHNGPRASGGEHLTPHRAFRWLGDPNAASAPVLELATATVAISVHDAFCGLGAGRTARAVILTEGAVTCFDWQEFPATVDRTIALAPGARYADNILTVDRKELVMRLGGPTKLSVGSNDPFLGWFSSTYGSWEPAISLETRLPEKTLTSWSVSTEGSVDVEIHGSRATVADLGLAVKFREDRVDVVIVQDSIEHVMSAELPK